MKKLYLLWAFVFFFGATASAQSFYTIRREKSLILSVGAGSSTYYGELKDNSGLDKKPTANLGLQYYLTDRISLRSELNWFVLQANDGQAKDPSLRRRNLSFRENDYELNVTGAVNLWRSGSRYYRRPGFNIYGFAGLGVTYFNPKAEYQGTWYSLEPLHTEGKSYSRVIPVIPMGIGARFKISPTVNFVFEGGYRKTFTDYLDDVSTVYPNPASLSSDLARALSNRYLNNDGSPNPNAGQPGTQRGDPKNKDGYFLLTFKVEYYLPGDFHLFGTGQRKYGSFNQQRKSPFSRYKSNGKLKR